MGIFENFRKPKGIIGALQLKSMNIEHTPVALWVLKHLEIKPTDIILDVGCGGGINIKRMAESAKKVYGIDYSIESVNVSTQINEELIEKGIVEISEGNVLDLPFEEGSFDIVTAFETVYFWPDIENAFGEVKRVLKPGGIFLIGMESNGSDRLIPKLHEMLGNLTVYNDKEISAFLRNNDYNDVTIYLRDSKNKQEIIRKHNQKDIRIDDDYDHFSISDKFVEWMCVIAKK